MRTSMWATGLNRPTAALVVELFGFSASTATPASIWRLNPMRIGICHPSTVRVSSMKTISKSDSLGDHPPHAEEVPSGEPPTTRAQSSAPPRSPRARAPGSTPAIDAPVIGTVEQWQSLSASDRKTLTLLDQRVHTHTSLEKIREYFSTGAGTRFPAWVRGDFLARVARCTVGELPSTATETGEGVRTGGADADPNGDGITDVPPSETKPTPARKSNSRPRRSRSASEVYLPAPTLILRSAIFRGVKGKNRRQKKYTPIAALEGIDLLGKGRMVSALDLIPWLGAVKLVRAKKTTAVVKVTLRSLLKATGRADGTRSRQLLRKQLKRIGKFKFKLDATWGATYAVYAGPLLCNFKMLKAKSGKKNDFECSVSAELLRVFEAGETYLKLRDLKGLSQRPLCLWLWGFYWGHERPFAMFVRTIRGLAGFDGPTFEFRRQLSEGLEFLKTQKLIASWYLDKNTDKITVLHRERGDESADE
jgi:hypothetical protein